ncbi:hypothetical protein BZL30_4380 [Mycobacterium kansasii]|uniref:Uncharacterized protein n=1 Tax=Mycobacterium kansasii TaxID=1768 RepID=A0A1V3X3M8_MYCKA|nr:hypothetical protein BZL30_4380 [Mycobacterium kansasii]
MIQAFTVGSVSSPLRQSAWWNSLNSLASSASKVANGSADGFGR